MVVLVVEDDPAVVDVLHELLTTSGYAVWVAESGAAARALLAQRPPDLILLDLMLPDTDGLVLISVLKALSPAVAIIILSARAQSVNRVLGLKLGADDVVAKPFDSEALLARIAAALRRVRRRPTPPACHAERIHIGQLTLARRGGPVTIGDERVDLTPIQHRLLVVLADHTDEVVSRSTLLRLVWGYQETGAGHLVDVHVGRLRLKLGHGKQSRPAIVTVRQHDYMLVSSPRALRN